MSGQDFELGVVHKFIAQGYDKMLSTKAAFDNLTESAERFTAASLQLGAAGASIAAIGYAAASPLLYLRHVLMTVGLEFESMNVQMLGLMGGNQKAADSYFSFLRNASEEIPYSFKEAVDAMKEFTFMGIDIKKQYDVKTVTDGIVRNSITGIQAISGLAAASGTSLSTIGHDLQLAITQGRADYLAHWIGPLKAQAMQMSGVFIGTWQQQWDKAIKWIGDRYAQESSNLARTYSGLLTGVTDMIERLQGGLLGLNSSSSAFTLLRVELGKAYDKWREFLTPAGSKNSDGLSDSVHKLSEILSGALMPSIQLAAKGVGFLTEKFIQLVQWATSDRMRPIITSWGRIGLAGSVLIAVGSFIILGGVIVGLMGKLVMFSGMISAMGIMFTTTFWVPIAALTAGLVIIERVFFSAEGSLTRFVERIRTGFEAVGAFFKVVFQTWENAVPGGVSTVSTAAWNKLSDYWKNKVFDFLDLTNKIKFDHKKFKAFLDKQLMHLAIGTVTLAIGSWAIGKLWKSGKDVLGLGSAAALGSITNPMYVIVVSGSGLPGAIGGAGGVVEGAANIFGKAFAVVGAAAAGYAIGTAVKGWMDANGVSDWWQQHGGNTLDSMAEKMGYMWGSAHTGPGTPQLIASDTVKGFSPFPQGSITYTGDQHFHFHFPPNWKGDNKALVDEMRRQKDEWNARQGN
jgi:hypothetical protein